MSAWWLRWLGVGIALLTLVATVRDLCVSRSLGAVATSVVASASPARTFHDGGDDAAYEPTDGERDLDDDDDVDPSYATTPHRGQAVNTTPSAPCASLRVERPTPDDPARSAEPRPPRRAA